MITARLIRKDQQRQRRIRASRQRRIRASRSRYQFLGYTRPLISDSIASSSIQSIPLTIEEEANKSVAREKTEKEEERLNEVEEMASREKSGGRRKKEEEKRGRR
jgi:hypothetical protein